MERKAFVAALNRANYVIEHLPNSSQVEQALEIKIEAYKELNQSDLANITQDLLDAFKERKLSPNGYFNFSFNFCRNSRWACTSFGRKFS